MYLAKLCLVTKPGTTNLVVKNEGNKKKTNKGLCCALVQHRWNHDRSTPLGAADDAATKKEKKDELIINFRADDDVFAAAAAFYYLTENNTSSKSTAVRQLLLWIKLA